MKKNHELKGSCACGNVKYKVEGNPLFTQACHCKNCKLSTGSSFVIHTMIMEEDFKISGDVASIDLPTGTAANRFPILLTVAAKPINVSVELNLIFKKISLTSLVLTLDELHLSIAWCIKSTAVVHIE